ncbi:prolyl oligopeptidase family serine peptidase [Motilimonas sp. KMU-193]|uniref:S9 family peptidase n=1 Tax=Motilimonas sp. KMU-193 TaxID=3388668 RepID=UPI00396B187B
METKLLPCLLLAGLLSACANTTNDTTSTPSATSDIQQADSMLALVGPYQVKHQAVELFFKKPAISNFQLSPNGKHISYLARNKQGRLQLFLKMDGQQDKQLTQVTSQNLDGYLWLDDAHLGYFQDNDGDENYQLNMVNVDTGEITNLTPFPSTRVANVRRIKNKPGKITFYMNKEDKRYFYPYSLDINTKRITPEFVRSDSLWGPIYDQDGFARVKSRWAPNDDKYEKMEYHYRNPGDMTFSKLITINKGDDFSIIHFNDATNEIFALTNHNSDKVRVVKFDMDTHQMATVFEHDDYDVLGAGFLPQDNELSWVYFAEGKGKLKPLSPTTKKLYQVIESKFSTHFTVNSITQDGKKAILANTDADIPVEYMLFDSETHNFTALGQATPWLKPEHLSEMHPVKFQSRDNLTIHGLLTLPHKKEKKNLPIIILPHGGPFGILNTWGYNPEVQMLAHQGYGVLQINYRGSGGYGKKFLTAGFNQFGTGSMQHDITDGVKWLIKQGIADPKRVMIYGASYGGYATLAGLAFTPDLYACGVNYVGISNLHTFLMNMDESWGMGREFWLENVGNPYTDIKKLREISPYYHVDKIKAPLFVAQGAQDPRVKQQESDQIVNALRKRGVEVKYMLKQDEGHGFHKEENQQHFYDEMIDFLASCPANNRI